MQAKYLNKYASSHNLHSSNLQKNRHTYIITQSKVLILNSYAQSSTHKLQLYCNALNITTEREFFWKFQTHY